MTQDNIAIAKGPVAGWINKRSDQWWFRYEMRHSGYKRLGRFACSGPWIPPGRKRPWYPKAEGTAEPARRLRGGQAHRATLFRAADNRTAIHLGRHRESDLPCLRSSQDVRFGGEPVRRDSRVETDEDLLPVGVEPGTLEGVDHRREWLCVVQVRLRVDRVDARVVRENGVFAAVRQL